MTDRDVRRRRLNDLVSEFGSQQALADRLEVEQNYISQLLRGKKAFGEKTARKIEIRTGKPPGWLDEENSPSAASSSDGWPFSSIDKVLWDRLSPQQKREIEASFARQVLGANIEQPATGRRKAG
jgi:transcriptional regulator with XRE-family HTH domain